MCYSLPQTLITMEIFISHVFCQQHTQRRSNTALSSTVPYIMHALQDDLAALQELDTQLPEIGSQVKHIRAVYDHGRDKASFLCNHMCDRLLPV